MIRLRCTGPLGNRRGAVLPLVAICLVVLLSMIALAVDLGVLTASRTDAQRAADAASLAGASVYLHASPDAVEAEARATDFAARNRVLGRLLQAGEVFVMVNHDEARVTVRVGRTQPTFFARLFGVESADVGAIATAQVSTSGTSGCIKPFSIPDDEYGDDDVGRDVLIWESRTGNPNEPGHSNFYLVGEGNTAGGNDIRYMLENTDCELTQVSIGDSLPAQPSNNAQGTVKTTLDKITKDYGELWWSETGEYDGFNIENYASHPLVATVPLYEPGTFIGSGGGKVPITGFMRLVVHSSTVDCTVDGDNPCQFEGSGKRQQLYATILPATGTADDCVGTGCADLNRTLRLVQ